MYGTTLTMDCGRLETFSRDSQSIYVAHPYMYIHEASIHILPKKAEEISMYNGNSIKNHMLKACVSNCQWTLFDCFE